MGVIVAMVAFGSATAARADEFDDLLSGGSAPPAGDKTAEKKESPLTFDFKGETLGKVIADLQRNTDGKTGFEARGHLFAQGVFGVSGKLSVLLSGLAEYHVATDWKDDRTTFEPSLWEFYATVRLPDLDLKLGQQIVTWGILDAINPINNVNPQDFAKIFYFDEGYTRLPIPAARATWYYRPNLYLEGVYIPFFRPMKFDVVGQDWSILGTEVPVDLLIHLMKNSRTTAGLPDALDRVVPGWGDLLRDHGDKLERLFDNSVEPRPDDFSASAGGARTGGSISGVDFAASYLYHYDDYPTLEVNPQILRLARDALNLPRYGADLARIDARSLLPLFRGIYHRVHTVGLEFGTSVHDVSLKAEAAYHVGRYAYEKDLSVVPRDVMTWSASAEYTLPGDVTLIGQYLQTVYPRWSNRLLERQWRHLAMLVARKTFLRDKLECYAAVMYDFSQVDPNQAKDFDLFRQDWMLAPILSYSLTDSLKLRAGGVFMGGSRLSLLGYYRNNSEVFASVKYSF